METETKKLERNASVVQRSFWQNHGAAFLAVVAASSLFMNVAQCGRDSLRANAIDTYYDSMVNAKEERNTLEAENRRLHEDIEYVASADVQTPPSSEAANGVFKACLDDPSGLSFSWRNLSRHAESGVVFRLHNTTPVTNAVGKTFDFGQPCVVSPAAVVRIAETHGHDYLLMMQERDSAWRSYEPDACPDGAYRFVRRDNEVMEKAVSQACLARAKATEFKSIPTSR